MTPRLLWTTLASLCFAAGLASACGGGEFAPGEDSDGGSGAGGSRAGTSSLGGAGAGGKSSKAGAGGSAAGGKAGASGVAGAAGTVTVGGSSAGVGGGGGPGTAGGGGGGMAGGGNTGPCVGKNDAECLSCCGQVAPISSYEMRSYECACSEPCYPLCEANCNTPAARSLECHRCTINGLNGNGGNLCQSNIVACGADPSCKAVTECLRTCL